MDELYKQVREGEFISRDRFTIELKSGVEVWIASGFWFYGFYHSYSDGGRVSFTFMEKIRFARAFKKGKNSMEIQKEEERRKKKIEIINKITSNS